MDFKYKYLPTDEPKNDIKLKSLPISSSVSTKEAQQAQWPCYCKVNVLRVPSRYVTLTIVLLPLSAFAFSVFWAFHSNFRAATLVFCNENQVQNYLPSLSAAIGDYKFSKSIWITAITLHAPPRFIFAYMYYKYLKAIIFKRYVFWAKLACILHVIENFGLLGLSYISSKASLPIHALNFTVFIISSELYMLIFCVLLYRCRNIPCATSLEFKSQRCKIQLFFIILGCSVILPYVYHRHNAYCEEGIYTIFAFLEYVVVLCNMGFHCTAYWDFYDVVFKIPLGKWLRF